MAVVEQWNDAVAVRLGKATSPPAHSGPTRPTRPTSGQHHATSGLTTINRIAIPAGGLVNATLSFWHRFTFEGGGASYFDGVVLETSTDGGATWQDAGPQHHRRRLQWHHQRQLPEPAVGSPAMASPGYPAFFQTTVDLLPYAGQNLHFRFRQGDDTFGGFADTGWW